VTLIQRFGSALNLSIHFHMLFLDGVYLFKGAHPPLFRPVAGRSANELQRLVEQIGAHVGQVLERRGPLDDLIGHSITYRIAVGPRAGQKLFTLQTVPPRVQGLEGDASGAARTGFLASARSQH
jgi:Putative transposase